MFFTDNPVFGEASRNQSTGVAFYGKVGVRYKILRTLVLKLERLQLAKAIKGKRTADPRTAA